MDVTKSNFKELKPQIVDAINKCTFAAIDCEFTGLQLPEPLHPLDTVAQRYQKLRAGISEYLVVQFGLSLWSFDEAKQTYDVKTFNIFTFPDGKHQSRFHSQASCLHFLVQHGFDLNRCVREGVPFLQPQELELQGQRQRSRHIADISLLMDTDKAVIEKVVNGTCTESDLRKPRGQSPLESAAGMDSGVKSYLQNVSTLVARWMESSEPDEDETLLLPACSDFVRMTVYRCIEKKFFESKFQMESVRPETSDHRGSKHIKLSRCSTSPIERLLQKQKEDRESLQDRFGVSSVLKALSLSRKPVVGHNCMRDLLHVIHQFMAPLPEDFTEFQIMCKELFPVLFDTKHMSSTGTIKSSIRGTRLAEVFSQIKNQCDKNFPVPQIHVEAGFGYDEETAREHEAGFDAWLTGFIFAAFAHSVAPRLNNAFLPLDLSHNCFKPFMNKMHFGPSLDISTIELDVNPPAVNRSDVYIIEWRDPEDHFHARYLLSMAGGSKRQGWGDQVLAFVPSNTETCIKALRAHESTGSSCRFFKHQSSKQGRRRKAKSKSPSDAAPNGVTTSAATTNTSAAAAATAAAAAGRKTSTTSHNLSLNSSFGLGVEAPKKQKLDNNSESRRAASQGQQSGPFRESTW